MPENILTELEEGLDDIALDAQPLDDFTAVGIAEGFIDAEDEEQVRAAWQHLHDTGLAYQLQGWFGRTAQHLIASGVISA